MLCSSKYINHSRLCLPKINRCILGGFAIVTLAIMLSNLCSCQKSISSPVDSITIGTVLQETSIPVFIALDRQFFSQNGLDVTVKYYDSGAQAINGVLQNEIDIVAPTSEYVMVDQVMDNNAIETIGCIDKLDFVHLIGRKDRLIEQVSDLKGKKIGLVSGTATEFFLGRFLTLNGLDIDDVTLVGLSTNSEMTEAIVNGDVDAIVSVSPYADDAQSKLGENAVSWNIQSGQMVYMLLVGRSQWVKSNPGIVERVLRAMKQTEEFMLKHPEESRSVAKKRLKLTDEDLFKVWDRNDFSLGLNQSLVVAMEDEARWEIKNGLTIRTEVPFFSDYIYGEALKSVKPESVNIIR
jgi:NitT/TauT family transport system substrate-binding protein